MPFVEEAESVQAKLHITELKPTVLVGSVLAIIVILFLLFQGLWQMFSSEPVTVVTAQTEAAPSTDAATEQSTPAVACVFITGCVVHPGVYEVAADARVQALLDAAGGFTEQADTTSVNLARVVVDGEQIIIPALPDPSAPVSAATAGASEAVSSVGTLININTATAEQLTALPGVGESTAAKIVADREKNGSFPTIEDLKRVSGIGDKKYESLSALITV